MWLTTVLLRRYTPGRIHGGLKNKAILGDRRQEERRMFNDSWQAYKARKMTDVYAFGPKQGKSKSENILEHLNVSRTEHD
ncbi:hypothetical protein OS493_030071 [Desmophyllum pertusum]|uniref:Uncharacterized protein n=1 Tax=Desmophyllum pertusum TaxID=174260 RepID=A0A9W9Z9J8_9CNID|nr:hypothetical protein OS493_030071 [Desmophyllum pertusum]